MSYGYLPLIIALGLVLLFGFWSGNRRGKARANKKAKAAQSYPLVKKQTKLRRIK